jgi:catalase (peroxidase I)
MALTSDVALTKDQVYRKIVQEFANNISTLDLYFKNAWYKLMTRDMGPVTRCVGPWVPPAQPFQFPLPAPPKILPNYDIVKIMLKSVLTIPDKLITPDYDMRGPNYYGVYIHLAHQSATTFRHTDYLGGINGARIRFGPQNVCEFLSSLPFFSFLFSFFFLLPPSLNLSSLIMIAMANKGTSLSLSLSFLFSFFFLNLASLIILAMAY